MLIASLPPAPQRNGGESNLLFLLTEPCPGGTESSAPALWGLSGAAVNDVQVQRTHLEAIRTSLAPASSKDCPTAHKGWLYPLQPAAVLCLALPMESQLTKSGKVKHLFRGSFRLRVSISKGNFSKQRLERFIQSIKKEM